MTDADAVKQKITWVFDTVATGYDHPALRFFPFCADTMINYLRPRPGSRVLDVATGTGAVAVAAGQVIGPQGRVQAIDLSEQMLARAQQNVTKMALKNVDFHVMDAEQLEFRHDYFDYVLCSFGLFFLPDMQAAVNSWMRVLKPEGKILFSIFQPQALEPMAEMFRSRIGAYGVNIESTAWKRLTESSQCQELLAQAGAEDIEVVQKQLGHHLNDAQDWWAVLWNSGFRGFLEQLGEQDRQRFQQEHLDEVAALAGDKGIWMDVGVHLASARKPGRNS
jgi:ubiquinone/menaquinone biosynthesis C-methylase UbiE